MAACQSQGGVTFNKMAAPCHKMAGETKWPPPLATGGVRPCVKVLPGRINQSQPATCRCGEWPREGGAYGVVGVASSCSSPSSGRTGQRVLWPPMCSVCRVHVRVPGPSPCPCPMSVSGFPILVLVPVSAGRCSPALSRRQEPGPALAAQCPFLGIHGYPRLAVSGHGPVPALRGAATVPGAMAGHNPGTASGPKRRARSRGMRSGPSSLRCFGHSPGAPRPSHGGAAAREGSLTHSWGVLGQVWQWSEKYGRLGQLGVFNLERERSG